MTYHQFNNIVSSEKVPNEHDLIEAFRYTHLHIINILMFLDCSVTIGFNV